MGQKIKEICDIGSELTLYDIDGRLRLDSTDTYPLIWWVLEKWFERIPLADTGGFRYATYKKALIQDAREIPAHTIRRPLDKFTIGEVHRDEFWNYVSGKMHISRGVCRKIMPHLDIWNKNPYRLRKLVDVHKYEIITHVIGLLKKANSFEEFSKTGEKTLQFTLDLWHEKRGKKYVENRLRELKNGKRNRR